MFAPSLKNQLCTGIDESRQAEVAAVFFGSCGSTPGKGGCLQCDREIFFFVDGGQGVKRDFEGGQGDIGGAAHQLKIDRMLTLGAFGKKLVTQKGNFVREPVVAMDHAVNAALRNFVTAAKLRF